MRRLLEHMGLLLGVAAVVFVWGAVQAWQVYGEYRRASAALSAALADRQAVQERIERRRHVLERARRRPVREGLQRAVMEVAGDAVREAGEYGLRVMVSVGADGGGVVDFAHAARPMEDVDGVLEVPVRIVVPATWESSERLYAWLRRSLLARQVFVDRIEFAGGVLKMEGRVFGLAQSRRRDETAGTRQEEVLR